MKPEDYKFYCLECTSLLNFTTSLITSKHRCKQCHKTRLCYATPKYETNENLSEEPRAQEEQTNGLFHCPHCQAELEYCDYEESGISDYGSHNIANGDNDSSNYDYDNTSTSYSCPECGDEIDGEVLEEYRNSLDN